jgi:hypothetical protein
MGRRFVLWSTVHSGKIYEHFRINPTPIFKVGAWDGVVVKALRY